MTQFPFGPSRRRFLAGSAAALAGAAMPRQLFGQTQPTPELGREVENAPAARIAPEKALRVVIREADGSPLSAERRKTLHARDLHNDPLAQAITFDGDDAIVELADEPIQLSCRLNVPRFGEVYCYADNGGHGYSNPSEVDFVADAYGTRALRIDGRVGKSHSGPIPRYDLLAGLLHEGELVALRRARERIAQFPGPRKDFFFGVMNSGFNSLGPKYDKAITDLFNFATVSWYTWKNEQPVDQRIDYARMDQSIDWCLERHITPKGFGYCYMARGATPEWIRPWSFEQIVPEYSRVVRQTMARYAGKLKYAEIINEAHDKANLWRLNQEQILRITKAVTDAAREGSPTVQRQINNCCLWAEYAVQRNRDGSRRWSPFRYIRDCLDYGVNFEVLGLQLYFPQQDLLEIDRMLDRFTVFNRPIHITELATASADGLDKTSMRPNTSAPGWHGPWSESTQADWVESIYTLVYSKPQFQAIGWWDLTDVPGHFWPFGGLLKADLTLKEAYHRLAKLQKDWGVAR